MNFRWVREIAKDIWFLGLVCPQIWLWFMLQTLDRSAPVSFEVLYVAQGVTAAVSAIVFFRMRGNGGGSPRSLSWLFAGAMCLAPLLVRYGESVFGAAALPIGAVLGGSGLVWCYLQYAALFSAIDLKRMASYLLVSFALVPAIRFPFEVLPLDVSLVLTVPLPLLAVFMCRKAQAHIQPEEPAKSTQEPISKKRTGLVLVVIELAVYGLVMGLFRVNNEGIHSDLLYIGVNLIIKTAFPVLFLVLIRYSYKRVSISFLCQIAMAFVLLAMVVASNFRDSAFVSFVVFDFARYVMVILLFFSLCALAPRTSLHPFVVFGAGFAPYVIALSVGMVLADQLGTFNTYSDSFIINLIALLTVSTVVVFNFKDDADVRLFPEGNPDEVPLQDFDRIDRRCEVLADQHGLTKRELETMQLICKGRSKRYIAEHLMISENTVRGYAKTLYAKLDVHNRQELLDLLAI